MTETPGDSESTGRCGGASTAETDAEWFQAILTYVETELGFATSYYNDSYLDRRISSRMRRSRRDSYEAYYELLTTDPAEQDALLDAMSINVTGFFRNTDVWNGIRAVLKSLGQTRDELRVWSAACADGREPYSLAMLAAAEPRIDESGVSVLATDISDDALETARRGVYQDTRTVDVGDQLSYLGNFHRYVETDGDSYRIRDPVQDLVTFERHDLINGDPKSGFDLVVCRNLFIYIDNAYKQPILETIARSLRPGGYLVIGKTETIPPQLKSAFDVADGRLRIYQLADPDAVRTDPE